MGDDYHSYYYDSLFGHYNGYDSPDNSDDADHLDDEDLGQPVTLPVWGGVNPFEYWTRGTDGYSYSYQSLIRGPLGANTLPNLDAGEKWSEIMPSWDLAHNYDSTTSYSYYFWPWLLPTSAVGGSSTTPSDYYILTYKYAGIEGLNSLNSAVAHDLPAYNKLYAWMHRISNAKLNDLEEDTKWWLFDSCDGPTCGPDRGVTVAATQQVPDVDQWENDDHWDQWGDFEDDTHWEHWDDGDHWEHVQADDHWEHWDDDDHWDQWDHDDHEDETDLWSMLMADNKCQEAKWVLSNYENGIEGMEHSSHHDLKVNCEYTCGNVIGECDSLNSQDFVNQQGCYRIKYGDLKELFEQQVNQYNDESMLALMNVMCGNVEIQCVYAIHFYHSNGGDQQRCFENCRGQSWDAGHDNYVEPCDDNFSGIWWEDDDHRDEWEDDSEGNSPTALWQPLMENNKCLEAKWFLSNHRNGYKDDSDKSYKSERELVDECEMHCGRRRCDQLTTDDFVDFVGCKRIMKGNLTELYRTQVIDAPDSKDREAMMSVMNVMCGNIEIECAYAAFELWDSVIDGRNMFEQLAEAVESPEKKKCQKECEGQMLDQGFDDMVDPCSSLMNSLSFAIILIISLVR